MGSQFHGPFNVLSEPENETEQNCFGNQVSIIVSTIFKQNTEKPLLQKCHADLGDW